jgi:hypothetical protein
MNENQENSAAQKPPPQRIIGLCYTVVGKLATESVDSSSINHFKKKILSAV